MSDLVLYTNPMSRGRIIRWMLEEVGQPYEVEIMGFGQSMKSEAYRCINPMGKVPALKHGDAIVTETAAICAYLADAFPEAGLAPPPGSPDRAAYYRWLFFAAGPLEQAVTNKSFGFQVPSEREGMAGYGNFALVMDCLEQAVSAGEYLAGGKFSAADLYVASHLGFGMQFGTIEKRPAFQDYTARMMSRPAMASANAKDDALMPAQPAA